MPKLSKRFLDGLRAPPEGKDLYVWDSEVRGFGYRLKANGKGAWILQYRKAGVSRRMCQRRSKNASAGRSKSSSRLMALRPPRGAFMRPRLFLG